jgi:hypothetical protein
MLLVSLCRYWLAVVLLACAAAPLLAQPLDARRIEAVAAMLPDAPKGVGPTIANRDTWQTIAGHSSFRNAVTNARKLQATPMPPMTDDDYLDYSRTGNRTRGQRVMGERHGRLPQLVLAECIENEGKFLAAIEDVVRSICDEKAWNLPAHDRSLKNFEGREYDIDLNVAAVAWNLATVDYWLGDKLSAPTRERIRAELRKRVFDPYEKHLKTGKPSMFWVRTTNNWNAVCAAGVTGAALATIDSKQHRAAYVAAAERNIQFFLDGFTDDGYCSEGVGYWNYGFGHYLLLSETLHQATGGQIDLMARPKVREIAQFGRRLEILPGIYPAFADCGIGSKPDAVIQAFVMRRFALPLLPAEQQREGLGVGPSKQLPALALYGLPNSATAVPVATTEIARPLRDYFQQAGILISRSGEGPSAFAVAMKAGHNAEHHNHNDVGSFVVALGAATPLLDPGLETYTARTFSNKRYDSNVLNSFGHPVPRVAGQLQRSGREAAGRVLKADFTPTVDTFAIDLRACYDVPSLKRLLRTFTFSREGRGSLTIVDEATFAQPQTFETALVTYSPWKETGINRLVVGEGPDAVAVELSGGGIPIAIEATSIKENLPNNRVPTRLGLSLAKPTTRAEITLTITPAE